MISDYRSFMVYHLPESIPSQSLRTRKIEKAWQKVNSFLSKCTDANQPSSIEFLVYEAGAGKPIKQASLIIKKAQWVFGKGERSAIAESWPDGKELAQGLHRWELKITELESALDFLIKGQPWPNYALGPVELIIGYDFRWIDPDTKQPLPYQDKHLLISPWSADSGLILWLSRNSRISIDGRFLFQKADKSFWKYVNLIEQYFPCRFERKYLRLASSNKKGTDYVFRRIRT